MLVMNVRLVMHTLRLALPIIAFGLTASGCVSNPVTGKRELALVSESQELEMGKQAAEQTRKEIGLVKDDALQDYVQRVGRTLAEDSERPELPWSFQVVDDATPNAFALPGGYIFVTRGLMSYMDSEAELAAVLGHEIGHVTARHSVQQISRAQIAQLGLGLGMILAPELQQFGNLLGSGLQLLFMKFGRDAERQADELGFGYALQDKYDVREMDDVFASLQSISQQENRSPLPTWAATHPDEGERIETVQRRVAELPPGSLEGLRTGEPEFMSRIEGLTFGDNPRQGFFEDTHFMHPDMAFEMTFPAGWKTQNLPQAVVAVSPQQDAAIQLTLTGGDPARAAQQFLGQQGLQAGDVARKNVNGLPAVLAEFAAQTQQGVVQGIVGFVNYKDATYQIVGYTPAQRYGSVQRALLSTIESFGPLRDSEALDKQPRRIQVVKLPRAMTLQEFSREYPSSVDLKTLGLINQVPEGSQLPAGKRVKRVIESRDRLTSEQPPRRR
jgi:predicted Zn-dependent protease